MKDTCSLIVTDEMKACVVEVLERHGIKGELVGKELHVRNGLDAVRAQAIMDRFSWFSSADSLHRRIKPGVNKEKMVKSLKEELLNILLQLDEIAPLKFCNVDYNGETSIFKDVVYDLNEDTVYIETQVN